MFRLSWIYNPYNNITQKFRLIKRINISYTYRIPGIRMYVMRDMHVLNCITDTNNNNNNKPATTTNFIYLLIIYSFLISLKKQIQQSTQLFLFYPLSFQFSYFNGNGNSLKRTRSCIISRCNKLLVKWTLSYILNND